MASNKNSSSNRVEVPEARDAMDRFKMEVANELGVNLKQLLKSRAYVTIFSIV